MAQNLIKPRERDGYLLFHGPTGTVRRLSGSDDRGEFLARITTANWRRDCLVKFLDSGLYRVEPVQAGQRLFYEVDLHEATCQCGDWVRTQSCGHVAGLRCLATNERWWDWEHK